MHLTRATRTLLAAVSVAGIALVAPTAALAETPGPDAPLGPGELTTPTLPPCVLLGTCDPEPEEPETCDEPDECFANPTEEPDDPTGEPTDDPGDDEVDPQANPVDEPVLANPTFTG